MEEAERKCNLTRKIIKMMIASMMNKMISSSNNLLLSRDSSSRQKSRLVSKQIQKIREEELSKEVE